MAVARRVRVERTRRRVEVMRDACMVGVAGVCWGIDERGIMAKEGRKKPFYASLVV